MFKKKIDQADTSKGPVVFTYNAHFYARDINFVWDIKAILRKL